MLKITFTDNALDYLKRREIADKTLILITDDGGGKVGCYRLKIEIGKFWLWLLPPNLCDLG